MSKGVFAASTSGSCTAAVDGLEVIGRAMDSLRPSRGKYSTQSFVLSGVSRLMTSVRMFFSRNFFTCGGINPIWVVFVPAATSLLQFRESGRTSTLDKIYFRIWVFAASTATARAPDTRKTVRTPSAERRTLLCTKFRPLWRWSRCECFVRHCYVLAIGSCVP